MDSSNYQSPFSASTSFPSAYRKKKNFISQFRSDTENCSQNFWPYFVKKGLSIGKQ